MGNISPSDELVALAATFLGVTDPTKFLVDSKLPEGSAWCMAFVQYLLEEVEEKTNCKSQIANCDLVMRVWDDSPKELRIVAPIPGSIVIWQQGMTAEGHTGVVKEVFGQNYRTIEGNSRNPATGQGRGVYEHLHQLNPTHPTPFRRLGFLKAF